MTIPGRTVVVTGAERGAAHALAEEALRSGAKHVDAGTRRPLAHEHGRVTALSLDVTDAAQTHAAVESDDSLDIIVNNAVAESFEA